ncbi:MAG TPA: hypothetical protein VFZ61_32055 [Polyangiales bacterium]
MIGYDEPAQTVDAAQPEPDASMLDAEPERDAAAVDDASAAVMDASPDGAPSDAAADARAPLGPWTTLPWTSGVHYGNEPPSYEQFSTFRGRPLDVVTLYVDRNSWAGLVNPDWWYNNFRNYPARIVLSEPLFPVAPTTLGNIADCALGEYDTEWRKLGTFLAARAPETVIRLGWGPNDPTHEWCAGSDPAEYISCFRRTVAAIRSTAPRVQIDFSIDPIVSNIPASGNPYDLYPGDDVVDIVGMDVFDRLPALRTDADWSAKCNAPLGLCTLIAFARAHGKRFSVGEWGITTCGEQPGGDNPFFIEKMVQMFAENADMLAYEAYFDDPGDEVCSMLYVPNVAPNARATYKRLYQLP